MALTDMYPAKNNSPTTALSAGIGSSDTTMTLDDVSVLPTAPNIAVIGSGDTAEIVKYTAINGSSVTIVRGQNGTTPGVWASGSPVARNMTALDHEAFRENILDLETRKLDSVSWGDIGGTLADQTDLGNALNGKQATLTFDSTPTSSSTNPVTSDGIKNALDQKADTSSLGTLATLNQVDLTSNVTDTLPVGNGGTNKTTMNEARDYWSIWYKGGDSISFSSGAGSYAGSLIETDTCRFLIPLSKPIRSNVPSATLSGAMYFRSPSGGLKNATISSLTGTIVKNGIMFDYQHSSTLGSRHDVVNVSPATVGSGSSQVKGITITFNSPS